MSVAACSDRSCWSFGLENIEHMRRDLIAFAAAFCCVLTACHPNLGNEPAALASVKFRIVAQADENPLSDRELLVFDGRVKDAVFEFVKTKAVSQKHYLTSVKTDGQGYFALDLSDLALTDVVIQPGPPYEFVSFERASNIGHMKSAFHIRVVRLEKGTRKVARNDIYDLRRHIVKQIGIDGGASEASFDEVLLVAPHLPKAAQP